MRKACFILAVFMMSTNGLAWAVTPLLRQPLPKLTRFAWANNFFYFAAPVITSVSGSPTVTASDPDGAAPSASVTVQFTVPRASGKNLTATLAVTSASSCGGIPIAASDVTVSCQSATGSTTITCNAPQSLTSGGALASSSIIKGNGVQTFSVTLGYTFADSWAKKAGSCTLPLTYTVDVQ